MCAVKALVWRSVYSIIGKWVHRWFLLEYGSRNGSESSGDRSGTRSFSDKGVSQHRRLYLGAMRCVSDILLFTAQCSLLILVTDLFRVLDKTRYKSCKPVINQFPDQERHQEMISDEAAPVTKELPLSQKRK